MALVKKGPAGWKNKEAYDYAQKLKKVYGNPSSVTSDRIDWVDVPGKIFHISVKDEKVPHKTPMPHFDFVWAGMKLKVSPEIQKALVDVSESIFVDRLKGEVWARCGMMVKNAVTLGLVEDLVKNKLSLKSNLKTEYSRRIKENEIPSWYKDEMKEKKMKKRMGGQLPRL